MSAIDMTIHALMHCCFHSMWTSLVVHAPPWHLYRCGATNVLSTFWAGCLQLLEILEISWNLIGPPGNFCVRCRRSTALVSSHKNMDKYLLQKYEIYRHQMCFLKFQMHQNPFSACRGAFDAPQIRIRLGRAEIPILWVFQLSKGGRSKANMSWIFLKIPPGSSWKFAWLNM